MSADFLLLLSVPGQCVKGSGVQDLFMVTRLEGLKHAFGHYCKTWKNF